ncbi:MAG TPA: hypothetical protein VG889_17290 [Rhizomicrobium sp.]|nr:hypothetical protein [Rhizomicrobium sp.]
MRGRIAIILLLAAALGGLAGCQTMRSVFHGGTPSTFIVFFPVNSAQMSPEAAQIVHDAATAINQVHPRTVIIAAGTTPGGNMEMSQPRFAAVRQTLIDDGVDQDLIARAAIADPKLDTMPAKQRVEIRLVMKGV